MVDVEVVPREGARNMQAAARNYVSNKNRERKW